MKKQWYEKQLRMLQTVLRAPDIVHYDANAVVDYLKKTNSNCIIVNAGGIMDFFDNETPLNRPNPFMTDENMLGDLVQACHANDIRVIVRVDFRGVEQERYEERPDWFAQNPDGSPVMGWNFIHKPCYNGIYANDHAVDYIKQMMTKYDIDGVWENAVNFGTGPCYCKRCRDMYREATGKEIPVGEDYAAPLFDEYRTWKAGCADKHLRRMRDAIKSFGEEKSYAAEIFGMFHASNALYTGIDLYNAKEYFDFLVSPAFLDGSACPGKKWDNLMYAASSMRFLKAIDNTKQTVLLYGNNGTKWRYIKAPKTETKIWMWEAAGVGAGYWNCMFNGQHPAATFDKRNEGIETEIYTYLRDHQEQLENQSPKKDAGIFYSKNTRDALGNDDEKKDGYGVFIKGAETALTDHHIQYNFIPDMAFSKESLQGVKTLILPNTAYMSDEQIEIIRDYVENGGGLVASFETSLYDENGIRRPDFGLKDLFGVNFTGMRRNTEYDCYQMVRKNHPVLGDIHIEDTAVIMNEGETLLTKTIAGREADAVCTYIPMIFNQPPEFAWIPEMKTEFPTVMAGVYGKGRVVYFANQTDKLCYTNGHEDFLTVFTEAVKWTANSPLSVECSAPSSVHITLMEKNEASEEKVLSFVNTTGGSLRPIREIVPVHAVEAVVFPKEGKKLKAEVMYGEDITFEETVSDGRFGLKVRINVLNEFAAVYMNEE